MKVTLFLGALTFLALLSAAQADSEEFTRFEDYDTNGDGEITQEEATRALHDKMDAFDNPAFRSGISVATINRISPGEEEMVRAWDQNGDGIVYLDEIKAWFSGLVVQMFEEGDTNRDGILTRDEFEAEK